jgi:hypothetical protein
MGVKIVIVDCLSADDYSIANNEMVKDGWSKT